MLGQRIGYIRVSTLDQNPERQLDNINVDRIFTDKASGKDTKRPELDALMCFVRTGDSGRCHQSRVDENGRSMSWINLQ